jgi:hypothetical protein
MIEVNGTRHRPASAAPLLRGTSLVVVGDRFEAFLANRGTIAASALIALLRSGGAPHDLSIVVGQGLSTERLEELEALVDVSGGAISTVGGIPVPADRRLAHKREQRNVMIGRPQRLADDRYVVDMTVDERNEVLEDHLTGQHIPAVALTEAARQTWTAVTEEFLLRPDANARFVVTSITSSFDRYVFPLPATLSYDLLGRESTAGGEAFHCRITVRQGGAVAAEIQAGYRTIWERLCAKQESIAARQAVADRVSRPGQDRDRVAERAGG